MAAAPAQSARSSSYAQMPEPEGPSAAAEPADARARPGPAVGRVQRRTLAADPRQVYYLYVPERLEENARILVTVHGISRNAREHAERFAPYARRQGVVLVAPRFGRKRFPRYQCLAPDRGGRRPDAVLEEVVAEVRDLLGLRDSRLYLFGFSGGGQFVQRYVMAHPRRVERAVIGAAGWYTFPDPARRYPYGTRARDGRSPRIDPAYLGVPVSVVVGDRDVKRDAALNRSAAIDRQQGSNRLERGRNWIAAMREAAREAGLGTTYEFRTLAGAGHHFGTAMAKANLGEAVSGFLFGEPGPPGAPRER